MKRVKDSLAPSCGGQIVDVQKCHYRFLAGNWRTEWVCCIHFTGITLSSYSLFLC